jgi:hypothetical protein
MKQSMSERSFRVSPLRLALLAELAEGLRYECGSGDWPMEEAATTIFKRIEEAREHYSDPDVPAREALAAHIAESVKAERERVLAIVETLIERFEHVATFKDGTQERVVYAAALEVELFRALREP